MKSNFSLPIGHYPEKSNYMPKATFKVLTKAFKREFSGNHLFCQKYIKFNFLLLFAIQIEKAEIHNLINLWVYILQHSMKNTFKEKILS